MNTRKKKVAVGCLGALGLVAALLGWASWRMSSFRDSFVVCDGGTIAGAPAYERGTMRGTAWFQDGESWRYAGGSLVPSEFPPADTSDEASLVLCIGAPEQREIEKCDYAGGAVILRRQEVRRVRAVESRTGSEMLDVEVLGSSPDLCPASYSAGPARGGVSVRLAGIPVATLGGSDERPSNATYDGGEVSSLEVADALTNLLPAR